MTPREPEIPPILPSEEGLTWDVKEYLKLEYRGGPVTNRPVAPAPPERSDGAPEIPAARRSLKNIELFVTSVDYAASLSLAAAGTVDFDQGTCQPAGLEDIVEVVVAKRC